MSERLSGLAQARVQVRAPWDEERAARVWSGVRRRQRRREVAGAVALVAVLGVGVLGAVSHWAPAPRGQARVTPVPPAASPPAPTTRVQRGGAVAGVAERDERDAATQHELTIHRPEPRRRPAPPPSWRTLAQEGDYAAAYGALHHGAPPPEDPEDLLLQADVARLSHHAAEAPAPLRRFLDRHVQDPRAPLAAFTLGRVLLDDLRDPRAAAAAFRRAAELAPSGELAEDALAREVEALSRAGDADAARERAAAYEARYPDGRRLPTVRRFGGAP